MKHAITTFNCLVAITVLVGCSGGSSSSSSVPETTSEGVTKALDTGVIPTLNADAGLSIKDTDSNGVRDDVDALIKSKYTVTTDISAATQFAKAMQMAVSASCCIPCDYVPVRSWPLFRARELMHQLIESFVPLGKEQVSAP